MALNVVMIGPPGAGKGTQAERICRHFAIPRISTGDILREAVQAGTPLGLLVQDTIGSGRLVSDDVMIEVVRDRLARPDAGTGFVLDGFPRTVAQARALDVMVEGRGPIVVIVFTVPEQELVRRLNARRVCSACKTIYSGIDTAAPTTCRRCGGELVQRNDDTADVIQRRQSVFAELTAPLVDYYQDRPTYYTVNGLQSPEQVTADLNRVIEAALVATRASRAGTVRA